PPAGGQLAREDRGENPRQTTARRNHPSPRRSRTLGIVESFGAVIPLALAGDFGDSPAPNPGSPVANHRCHANVIANKENLPLGHDSAARTGRDGPWNSA